MEEQARELRRIRITLIVLVIAILISVGSSEVNVDFPNAGNEVNVNQEKVVPLGEGRFGVLLNGDYMEIFEYDAENNQLKKVKAVNLYELESE